jgi:hypothetical protein
MFLKKIFDKAVTTPFDILHFLDPKRGRHDRAILRDRSLRAIRRATHQAEVSARGFQQRVRGRAARLKSQAFNEPVTDDLLVRRAAAALGRLVSDPHQVGLTADEGKLIVTGFIPASELKHSLEALAKVRGVKSVETQLDSELKEPLESRKRA